MQREVYKGTWLNSRWCHYKESTATSWTNLEVCLWMYTQSKHAVQLSFIASFTTMFITLYFISSVLLCGCEHHRFLFTSSRHHCNLMWSILQKGEWWCLGNADYLIGKVKKFPEDPKGSVCVNWFGVIWLTTNLFQICNTEVHHLQRCGVQQGP